jgi:hypothetical protein
MIMGNNGRTMADIILDLGRRNSRLPGVDYSGGVLYHNLTVVNIQALMEEGDLIDSIVLAYGREIRKGVLDE